MKQVHNKTFDIKRYPIGDQFDSNKMLLRLQKYVFNDDHPYHTSDEINNYLNIPNTINSL